MLTLSMATSVYSPLQAATPCSQKGQPDRSFYLGGFGQLGLKDLSGCAPGGDGRGSSHHPAQAAVHQRYREDHCAYVRSPCIIKQCAYFSEIFFSCDARLYLFAEE